MKWCCELVTGSSSVVSVTGHAVRVADLHLQGQHAASLVVIILRQLHHTSVLICNIIFLLRCNK